MARRHVLFATHCSFPTLSRMGFPLRVSVCWCVWSRSRNADYLFSISGGPPRAEWKLLCPWLSTWSIFQRDCSCAPRGSVLRHFGDKEIGQGWLCAAVHTHTISLLKRCSRKGRAAHRQDHKYFIEQFVIPDCIIESFQTLGRAQTDRRD